MQDQTPFRPQIASLLHLRHGRGVLARILAGLCLAVGLQAGAQAETAACEVDRPVRFGGMNWESNLLLVEIERSILENGYGCKTQVEPGETVAMIAALERGDVDINSEIWPNQTQHAWGKALESGKVIGVGHIFTSEEGWYIPRYTAKRYPDIREARDLLKHADAFVDPEDPSRSIVYGCPVGWTCETVNQNLLRALNMDSQFSVLSPGNGAALKAAIQSNYRRQRDIAFYYWSPTPLEGSLDLVRLELPAFDEQAYVCLTRQGCTDPLPSDFQPNDVMTGLNKAFAEQAPAVAEFFSRVSIPREVISAMLARMESDSLEYAEAARLFLREHGQYWQQWVPADVAQRVQAAL